jgi:small subunit ribosomal protein S8
LIEEFAVSMTDPIADMFTRIRNASKAKKKAVDIPSSNMKLEIARILKDELFIKDMISLPDNKQGILRVYLKYSRDDDPIIKGLRRISRPGIRRYYSLEKIKDAVRSQVGTIIFSTSKGVMTGQEALEKQVGGEAICAVW